MTIVEQIALHAMQHPESIAYISNDVADGALTQQDLTWHDLDVLSGKLAFYLETELHTKRPVIVYGHKSPLMPICFLACAKSGRAYVPVDISVPASRVQDIIDSIQPEIILLTEAFDCAHQNVLTACAIRRILASETEVIGKEHWIGKEDVFYIIFTSGSTGKPKGVQITRDCLDNFIHWGSTLIDGSTIHRWGGGFVNQAPFSFDLSVMDLYLSLYSGGTEFAISKKLLGNTRLLLEAFGKSRGTVWVSTPSFADMCLADKAFCSALLPNLKTFLFCGETLGNNTVERLFRAFPGSHIYNTYGPTESTVAVTGVLVTPEINGHSVPLPVGKPKPGTWILICDENGAVLPDGESGEIVIAGDSVSIGYWNDTEKTSRAFGTRIVDGREYRSYRTGDKGFTRDGMLYYGGRIDFQIKLHGYRIELGDIENNLMKIPGVQKAAVLPSYRQSGEVRSLSAYLVLADPPTDGTDIIINIKKMLGQYLPDYMIPKKIKIVDSLPMTANGKIDRRALGGL